MVIDLRRRLDEHRAKADCEQELVVIHRNIAEREREAVMQVNHQLLSQIKVREAQRVIELGAWDGWTHPQGRPTSDGSDQPTP